MRCPKCGCEQEGEIECLKCGIVYSKYRALTGNGSLPSFQEVPKIRYHDMARDRRQMILLIALLAFLGVSLLLRWVNRPIVHPPGVLISSAPVQAVIGEPRAWQKGDRVIVPLALFRMRGRVLGTEVYRWDATSDLAPVDVALGWGPMSDQRIVDALDIVQGSRRYMMTSSNGPPPLPISVLLANSSNMHMIPANSDIENELKALRVGQILELSGFLVGVQKDGNWVWVSSLSRTDTGDGACEIVWVERLRVE